MQVDYRSNNLYAVWIKERNGNADKSSAADAASSGASQETGFHQRGEEAAVNVEIPL